MAGSSCIAPYPLSTPRPHPAIVSFGLISKYLVGVQALVRPQRGWCQPSKPRYGADVGDDDYASGMLCLQHAGELEDRFSPVA